MLSFMYQRQPTSPKTRRTDPGQFQSHFWSNISWWLPACQPSISLRSSPIQFQVYDSQKQWKCLVTNFTSIVQICPLCCAICRPRNRRQEHIRKHYAPFCFVFRSQHSQFQRRRNYDYTRKWHSDATKISNKL